jgi:hypothetical protein
MQQQHGDVPQFATAEYSSPAGALVCKSCGQSLGPGHYRINGVAACAPCAQRFREQLLTQDSHAAFTRGVVFGSGAALLGLAIYVGFALSTGWVVGYVSLAVGYLVGKAIITGSRGQGGRRYQVAAVILTYMAVSLAAVPIALSLHAKHRAAQQQQAQAHGTAAPEPPKMDAAKAVGILALLGLASPFLDLADPMHGLIGLIILFVGLRIAWKLTAGKPVEIIGPIHDPVAATPG